MAVVATLLAAASPAPAFVTFESGQVRPLAKSPDGTKLFACNTPDGRLEVFDISGGGMAHVSSVPVGLEPVAVAARSNTEVWVVNHLSDSVSIVDVSNPASPRVTRTLTVGDEPRDIVFGGPLFDHAYITCAHRGQNNPNDPELSTEGIGRADVWVFDSGDLGSSFGGDEVTILELFGDTPRPLAVSADGSRVYAGVFLSGNQTTVLGEGHVPNVPEAMGGLPDPKVDVHGDPAPEVGLIVKYDEDADEWVDELGRDWSSIVKFDLPDYDVFAIDATQDPPVQVAGTPGRFAHVGTTLFNIAVRPGSGKLFVSNLEAFNEVRFEGPGDFADTTVRGHLVESRITVIDPVAETVTPRHLNKHIDYDSPFAPAPNATNDDSLAFPLEMAFTGDGATLYVAALGSSKVGVFPAAAIENDTFVPDAADHVELTGGGPTGLVLDEANGRLFVLTRFDNSISVVDTAMQAETSHVPLHNPEPDDVVAGRPFLYDARFTSSRGDQACASCHIFGDMDGLAWDLGNPDEETAINPSPLIIFVPPPNLLPPGLVVHTDFHPMKGPMTTQSLRGMDNHGPMHWRGDRTGGLEAGDFQPDSGIFNEVVAFNAFNPAFVGLIGRDEQLTDDEMQSFTDFILQVMYPPNPIRSLDDSLTPDQASALNIYNNRITDTLQTCNGCHVLNPAGNDGLVERPGFFGTDGRSSFENETQVFKVAHLRNLYQKVGMFGMSAEQFLLPGDHTHKGDQIRGFGFLHDGSIDTVFRFFQATVFQDIGATGFQSNAEREDMESLMMAFDTNHKPVVGQQATLSPTSGGDADARVDLLVDRADAGDCEVVAKGVVGGEARGWWYAGGGQFQSDRVADGAVAEATLRALAETAGQELTFTAVPLGEGERSGIDRDLDGFRDADEVDGGGDPTDPASLPCNLTETGFVFGKAQVDDARGRLQVSADVVLAAPYDGEAVAVELADGDGQVFSGGVEGGSFTVNSKGNQWKYRGPKKTPGITHVKVKALKDPNAYRVTIKTDKAWTAPAADETTATTGVVLHVVDECFEGQATRMR